MANYVVKYDPELAGAKVQYDPKDGVTEQAVTSFMSHGTVYSLTKGVWYVLTGYYYVISGSDVMYMQTDGGMFITAHIGSDGKIWTWILTANFEKQPTYSQTEAQYLVNKIIKNDIQIVQNNLVCARYANKFTAAQQQQIRDLQNRVTNRQELLKQSGLCENTKTSYPKGYADLGGYLDKLMKGESVGIATWAIVLIAATVIAATATAAYFMYKEYAAESETDIKYSKELMAVLANKLTPEEYQQLLNETKGIVTKAKIKASIGGFAGSFKWLAAIVGGYVIYKVVKNNL